MRTTTTSTVLTTTNSPEKEMILRCAEEAVAAGGTIQIRQFYSGNWYSEIVINWLDGMAIPKELEKRDE